MLIVKLIKTFKDSERIYFLTEFVLGKDLFNILSDLGILKESDARFYIAAIILILEYLHEREIVHRDIKPENIMIDVDGYPKLIDFGTAKIVQGRAYSRLGTPYYMAPEVILGEGYNQQIDYWSLGVMLYEFLCGNCPFGVDEEDAYSIYKKVLEHRLEYPSWVNPNISAKPLIEQLLSVNPAIRTGGSVDNLKHN